MQNNELHAKMNKQVGVSLEALNWFILCRFLKGILEDETATKQLFKSQEDYAVIEGITKRIGKQFSFDVDRTLEEQDKESDLENILKLPPKKLILPKGGDIIA
jgi:hypothetical protein